MDREEIARLTYEYGGDWGVNHSRRLLHLVSMLGEELDYNEDIVWLAAYLHDWGGYQKWMIPGMDHQVRSVEVARQFLQEHDCPPDVMAHVLECIEWHHGGKSDRSIESVLFTDADALDLLGVVGVLRVFSMVPRNLKAAVEATKRYCDTCLAAITLEKTRAVAEERLRETEHLLAAFQEETFGYF